jgi:soluble lytic murein transglycosylase-like protein
MLSNKWDPLFSKYADQLPIAFMRALSQRESRMNPNESDWPAYGLMQVVPTVRKSYNKRHGTSFVHDDLLDPDLNVKMAASLLNRIIIAYNKHPDPNMKKNWANPEFVKLLVAGWNSGYSEAGGVGRVAKYLEARGTPVTHDSVFANAGAAGATRHLQNPKKRSWQRSVVDLYYQQPDALVVSSSAAGFLVKVGIAVVAGLVIAKHLR